MGKTLVAGAGRSGIEAAQFLLKTGRDVVLFDSNESIDCGKLRESIGEIPEGRSFSILLGDRAIDDAPAVDFCVISPGISPEAAPIEALKQKNVPIISEIELGYGKEQGTVVAITGTNGKTTTTTLSGDILRAYFGNDREFTVGNIGVPYTKEVLKSSPDSVSVIEVSSFQLETIDTFHPHVAAILNITPDHLNRHHTMEEYVRVKGLIAKNQTAGDVLVLNARDPYLTSFAETVRGPKIVWFSGDGALDTGYFLRGDELLYSDNGQEELLIRTSETTLVGKCNYENILAAFAIADAMGVPRDLTRSVVRSFRAVPHRIEYVRTYHGVKYYNDSKGTNPDAAIQGIRAMTGKTVLIGGGYDKGSEFDEWIDAFDNKVKRLILIGVTKEKIRETAERHGFTDVTFADSLEEAVSIAKATAVEGENVLLSPACASWDMFKSYEQRGDLFKEIVNRFE